MPVLALGGLWHLASVGAAVKPSASQTDRLPYRVEVVAKDLRVVWSMVFTSPRRMLFTERPGRVRVLENETLRERPLLTIGDVDASGKLGALGMTLDPRYARNRRLYLAYSYRAPEAPRVRVVRYRDAGTELVEPLTVIEGIPGWTNHAGCRLRFGPDAKLYVTTGDADKPDLAQRLDSLAGKTLRLNGDGTIPRDNPFVATPGARPEIWTYGHRNSQGIDFQPGTGALFESEHDPTGGDEINILVKGKNYGWPKVHHEGADPGMVSPIAGYGLPSPAPASTVFYHGRLFPGFKGDLLVGCLRGECILRLRLDGQRIVVEERLLERQYGRIRDVVEAPDGSLYVTTSLFDPPEANGRTDYDQILRVMPRGTEDR